MSKSVAIITPTIGSDHLDKCMSSVNFQTYPNVKHLVVIDGPENASKAYNHFPDCLKNVEDICLGSNVGAGGWYGHRIYAAFSYLVNEDLVCFLDEDNWLEANHVEEMVKRITEENLDWTHCLRNIYRKDGTFACQDNCESLGSWNIAGSIQPHIDTSSFMVKREILVSVAGTWYGQWGADRQFFGALKQWYPNWDTTCNYSLNYRLAGNPGSVTEDFFINGNKYMEEMYQGNFPWRNNPK